ncbi:hypothetical protein EV421DRAFT_858316 [Armillaria borealis]|uniref:DUF6699 domain-containing protein n=1 Tax=Armillaria borealis TaxID=47425 RepID=A0AA39JDK3_9AGAR|nr:hypothetical protein EV421DRAFT_858316 [Armillaria borealis]
MASYPLYRPHNDDQSYLFHVPGRRRNQDYRYVRFSVPPDMQNVDKLNQPPPYSAKPMEQAFPRDQRPQHTRSKHSPVQRQRSRATGMFSKRPATVVHGTPRPRRRLTKPPPDTFVPLPGTRPRQSRPRDWRADYRPGRTCGWQGGCCLSSCFSLLCCCFRPRNVALHPVLSCAGRSMYYDLRQSYHSIVLSGNHILDTDISHQLAVDPSVSKMRIFHPLLPWEITVRGVHGHAIRIVDVLRQIERSLHTNVRRRDIDNVEITSDHRARINLAFGRRVNAQAIQRVDFLEHEYIFAGLEKVTRGSWRMKTLRF